MNGAYLLLEDGLRFDGDLVGHPGETLGEVRRTWSGTPGAKAPEAPHLYHIGDFWYLLIAEGGTERGHGVSVARGPSPTGPFEACPANPIVSHRSTEHPVQNTGHGDLIEAPAQHRDAFAHAPAVDFQLRFAGTARTDTAAKTRQVLPLPRQARQ